MTTALTRRTVPMGVYTEWERDGYAPQFPDMLTVLDGETPLQAIRRRIERMNRRLRVAGIRSDGAYQVNGRIDRRHYRMTLGEPSGRGYFPIGEYTVTLAE